MVTSKDHRASDVQDNGKMQADEVLFRGDLMYYINCTIYYLYLQGKAPPQYAEKNIKKIRKKG